ncbi:MAG TPA: hypothetical protein VJ755_13680 [Gemmatimonadales bacterium]|nr:hypothetical protein [Gemmatimonadales bacterium]
MKSLGVTLLCILAACQPSANRLLLLDMSLGDPLVVEAVATPWHEAGYRVEHRRFYPHLTRADLTRYRTLVILGGREPERLSDALTLGDLAILHEWVGGDVRRGREGVVVLAYTSDGRTPAGSLDRWTMNQWLASLGAGIRIGETPPPGAPAVPLPHSSLDNAGFAAFPVGRNQTLQVRDPTQVLARAPGSNAAFVAASRMNDGLIVVVGREFLASASEDSHSHDYLVALARWTRRPAEWAQVGAATGRSLLQLAEAPGRVGQHPPPLAPPAGASVTILPAAATPLAESSDKPPVPNWIARQGMRVFWTRFTLHQLDSVLDFADAAALNVLATVVPVPAIVDTMSTRFLWRNAAERFQTTSVRWFPAVALFELPSEAEEIDRHGALQPVPCGLDSAFWRGALRSTYRTLARLGTIGVDAEARARRGGGGRVAAPARADVVAGVALDLDSAAAYYRGTGFCDVDYQTGVAALRLDSAETERVAMLPPAVRYDTLLERGLLARYFDTLQAATRERARALRAELQRLRPDLRFAFRSDELPGDWFSLGLLQGFSSADTPVLLWLGDRRAGELLARYRARGIYALSALRLEPEHNTFAPSGWNRLRPIVFDAHSGFWLDRAVPDTIARMIRRTTR